MPMENIFRHGEHGGEHAGNSGSFEMESHRIDRVADQIQALATRVTVLETKLTDERKNQ
jgi:hypothetical protein